MPTYDDDAIRYVDDPRVTPKEDGLYLVDRDGFTFYVQATDDYGWVVSTSPTCRTLKGCYLGFECADDAIAAVLIRQLSPAAQAA